MNFSFCLKLKYPEETILTYGPSPKYGDWIS